MCGLVSVFAPASSLSQVIVETMRDRLAHRGPDGYGLAVERSGELAIALAHRRLSILDLSDAAAQPMRSPDGRAVLVFNGEIYNFVELRDELRGHGFVFRTTSDTEVLLAAYRHWGTDCVQRLNGMFAFVIWDADRQRLFIARDRFGEKPLFHARLPGGGRAFASEMKALFAHPELPPSVSQSVLAKFGEGRYLEDGEETLFEGVLRVPPAHALLVAPDGAILRQWRYWTPDYEAVQEGLSAREATEGFLARFQESIRKRLRSDVPIGTSLSGGLDSSMIVCSLSAVRAGGTEFRQNSFSARFEDDPTLSEGEYIDLVARAAGVRSHGVTPTPQGLAEECRRLHWHQEEPFLSASIYLQWCVARLARENDTTVLLDGQGADELLGGYQFYFPTHQRDLLDRRRYAELLWTSALFNARLKRASRRFADSRRRFNEQVGIGVRQLLAMIRQPVGSVWHGPYEVGVPKPEPGKRLRRVMAEALQYNGLPTLLRYADRNAMAFGREGRLPFLDYDLVDYCISLPDSAYVHNGWQKYVLRRAGEGLLPRQVQWRADKVGYAAPLDVWMRGALKDWAWDRLQATDVASAPGFDRGAVQALWDDHQAGRANNSWALWRWISLGEWLAMHREGVWRSGM
jgi:asparagine synthase (glutamine-hydrolysing)